MLNVPLLSFLVILVLALAFEFINGFHDTANSIATTVSTRALTPSNAIVLAAILNLLGAFYGALTSAAVVKTISKGIVSGGVPLYVIGGALVAAIIWNLVTWYIGIPSSSSHAIIGALIGATIGNTLSTRDVIWSGLIHKVIIPLFTSPVIGLIAGFLFMTLLFKLLSKYSQAAVNKSFSKIQIVSAALMAFSHGSNDAQKTIGIIMLALTSVTATNPGALPHFLLPQANGHVPIWIIACCAAIMGLGTSVGGWRIIKTVGMNMLKMQPIGGFAAQTAAAMVIQGATLIGAPVSTTHVITSSIIGVGSAKRVSSVRWAVVRDMVASWFLTIPICIIIGALTTIIFNLITLR